MKPTWERLDEDQYLYTGPLPESVYRLRLVYRGDTTAAGSKLWCISYTKPTGEVAPYIAIKRVGKYERTQWNIHTAKANAERWLEIEKRSR